MNNSVTLGLNLFFSVSGSTLLEIFLAVSSPRPGQATNWPQVNRYFHQPLTSYTIKSHRGLYRSVVHYKIIPTSDREVLCPQIPFQCLTVKRGTKVESHCHSPFVPVVSKTQVGSILLQTIIPIACKENIFIERMSVHT